MRKTLFSKKNIVRGIITISMVVFSYALVGCSELEKYYEEQRLEQEQQKEETMLEANRKVLYGKLEEIYIAYSIGENEELVIEFEKFLEENFSSKERILEYFERKEKYNNLLLSTYEKKQQNLEEELNQNQITKKEFKILQEELEKDYEEDLNEIQDYFSASEEEILVNSKEEIDKLYNLL